MAPHCYVLFQFSLSLITYENIGLFGILKLSLQVQSCSHNHGKLFSYMVILLYSLGPELLRVQAEWQPLGHGQE